VHLRNCDYVAIQEHGLSAQLKAAAGKRLREQGWDAQVDSAYWKTAGYGGGTAVMAKEHTGLVPVALRGEPGGADHSILDGRFSVGVLALMGGVTFASVYGISGLGVKDQLRLWRAVAWQIKLLGLPFILAGDWQVGPSDMIAAGFHRLLGAEVFAPPGPTNLNTGTRIDYFVVDARLACLVMDVDVALSTKFTPHAPVNLRLRARK
jgi:hypothetical protein